MVVVGGSSSIGGKVVAAFAGAGDRVLATYRTSRDGLAAAASVVQLDLTDAASRGAFCAEMARLPGGLDVLILLPSILPGLKLADYGDDQMDQVMATNFTDQAKLLKGLLPSFAEDSLLLIMSSISGERGSFDPIYAASKGAMIAFGKSLATALAPRVRVVTLAPALIDGSTMWEEMSPERREFHRQASPMKKLLDGDELARITLALSQPHFRTLNGAVVRLNGGAYV